MKTIFTALFLLITFTGFARPQPAADTTSAATLLKLQDQGNQMIFTGATVSFIGGGIMLFTPRPRNAGNPFTKAVRSRKIGTGAIFIGVGVVIAIIGYTKLRKAGISIKGNAVAIDL